MALVVADRVQETTTTSGTGTITLAGAVSGFQTFAAIGNANTTYYTVTSGTAWEVGIGTYTSSGTTLSRDTVLASSAGGTTKISLSGTSYVFCVYPAGKSFGLDQTLGVSNGGTGQTSAPAAQAALYGFTTTATASGTTTLSNTSSVYQVFTGTLAQTITLPSTATLATGWFFHIVNNSTGTLTVQTSTSVSLGTIPSGVTLMASCIDTTVNTAAGWETGYTDFSTITGTGANVLASVPMLTDPQITGTILEDIFTITDAAAFEVDPGNGSIQLITLGASRTPKATNFTAGEAITLMVDDGTAYTITWTDTTWGPSGVTWLTGGGTAPTLNTTGYTAIVLWKVSTQVYGARVG